MEDCIAEHLRDKSSKVPSNVTAIVHETLEDIIDDEDDGEEDEDADFTTDNLVGVVGCVIEKGRILNNMAKPRGKKSQSSTTKESSKYD